MKHYERIIIHHDKILQCGPEALPYRNLKFQSKKHAESEDGTSWWCAGSGGAGCSRAARQRQPLPPAPADRTQTQAAGTSAVAQKPAAKKNNTKKKKEWGKTVGK